MYVTSKDKDRIAALKRLARQVAAQEKDTVAYLVHIPDMPQPSLPTPIPKRSK